MINSYSMMNFTIHYPTYPTYPFYTSSQDAAVYYNSLCPSYDYQQMETPYSFFPNIPYQYALFTPITVHPKADTQAERSTSDSQEIQQENDQYVKQQEKEQATQQKEELIFQQDQAQQINLPSILPTKRSKKEKTKASSLKKNTEANLINNIVSYVCSQMRSHKAVTKLLKTTEKKKIFYAFMNNLKKLNSKYLNRKNVQALLELTPNQPHQRVLARSVKRLQILPIPELKVILRRLIQDYIRSDLSIISILTSKKICRAALKENIEKRRELLHYFFKGKENHLSL